MRSMIFTNFDVQIQELYELETLVKMTKDACLVKECSDIYYDLSLTNRLKLSEERNSYINLLSVALDKIEYLQNTVYELEDKLNQL